MPKVVDQNKVDHRLVSAKGTSSIRGEVAPCKWCGVLIVHHWKTGQPMKNHTDSSKCKQARLAKMRTKDRLM